MKCDVETKGSLLWPITFDGDPSQDFLALNQCRDRESVMREERESDRERKI